MKELIDGQSRYAALNQQHMVRIVNNKDGSPLKNRIPIRRNAPCPCNSGKKFKNCHQLLLGKVQDEAKVQE